MILKLDIPISHFIANYGIYINIKADIDSTLLCKVNFIINQTSGHFQGQKKREGYFNTIFEIEKF